MLSNYAITSNTASFTITTKEASVTPDAQTKEYGSVDPTLTGTLVGFLGADNVVAAYSRAAGETVLGGPYTISASLSPGAVLSNYAITSNTAAFSITTKAASVTPAAVTKVYGAADPAFTGSLSGFVASDSVTAVYTRSAGQSVGSYAISATLAPAGVLGNYDITSNTAALTITPATLTVTADGKSKLFGAVDPALTYQATGLQFTDSAASVLSGALTRDAGESAGSYTIRQGTLVSNGNYTISFTTGTLTIGYNTCLLYDPLKGVKSGATIPIKIRLCSATGVNASASTIVVTATALSLETTSTSGVVEDAGNANPEGNFRFDTGLGPGYIFNLKTTGLAKGTWRLHFTVSNDPQPHFVRFQVQ